MAKQQALYNSDQEQQLMLELWSPEIYNSPLNFALFAFPWGRPNTPLEHIKGPRGWQRETFQEIERHIKANDLRRAQQALMEMWRSADASGRGIGKSALVSMLTLWFLTTRLGSTTIITANTEQQLRSRTMAELGKWTAMAINSHWWEPQAMSLRPAEWFGEAVKRDLKIDLGYWYAAAQLWSEENPDAFAGIHNHHGVMLIMDEASGIPKPIWTVSEGFFTEPIPDRYWFVFSNPRRNSGAFFECFHKDRNFWKCRNIDSRSVEGTDRGTFDKIIAQYGEDSDEARIEVKGEFPNKGANQFIGKDVAYQASTREIIPDPGAPLLMGVDVARFGEDKSVICFRKGRDARSIPWKKFKGLDTVQLASAVADLAGKLNPQAIFVDGNGVGGGVVDNLKAWGYRVIEVQAGSSASDGDMYQNKRVEMWGRMREWLMTGAIPQGDSDLITDLISPEYAYHPTSNRIVLEGKDHMKSRGLASPDAAEALALTFAQPVARIDTPHARGSRRNTVAKDVDYAIFG
jgi:hypothetical protein